MIYFGVFAALIGVAISAPVDWEGTFNDPVYGGDFKICVTYSADLDTYYAQGKFSDLGYIRGTVDASDVWTGEYWVAGREGKHGSFNLTLSNPGGGNPLTYDGYFNEMPGYMYSLSGVKSSSSTPSDMECFRSDVSLLTSTGQFDFTGHWLTNDDDPRLMYTTSNTLMSSYYYAPPSTLGGYHTGPVYANGQVHTSNWFEDGDWQGLYLFVAKDANTLYSLWWEYDVVADFDYSKRSDSWYFGQSMSSRSETYMTYESANVNACLMIEGEKEEKECIEEYNERLEDEDEEGTQVSKGIAAATLAFGVANVVTVIAIISTIFLKKPAPGNAGSANI